MKSIFTLLIFLISFFIYHNSYSQCPSCYQEQVSGVTKNLTSAFMSPTNAPIQVWVCGDSGTVLKTTNAGVNWTSVGGNGIPSIANLVNICCKSADTVVTAGNIGNITYVYRTSNGGSSWSQVFSQINGSINAIWLERTFTGFMVGNPVSGRWSLWKTTNRGLTWDSTGIYLPQVGSETGWKNSLSIYNNRIWFGTNNSRIYFSSNYGANWISYSTAPEINSSAIWVDPMDSTKLAMGGSNEYYTTNGGITWLPGTCPGTGNFCGFCGGIPGASNNINNWPGPFSAIRNTNNVYETYGNLGGAFFVDYTAPSGIYNHMAFDYYDPYPYLYQNFTWIVRSNGGITRMSTSRGGAVNRISTEIPKSYSLEQNYPNPFNPATKIRFDLKKEAFTTIKVYDVLGREVAMIVNEQLRTGVYEADFDASMLSSGIYYYRISAGDYSEVKKMVVVK